MDGGAETFLRPAWMSSLLNQAQAWIVKLPQEPKSLQFDPRDPLARYFAREVQTGIKLLRLVKKHLGELVAVCEGIFSFFKKIKSSKLNFFFESEKSHNLNFFCNYKTYTNSS